MNIKSKYIIFDFDGTLVDSEDVVIEVFNKIAGKYQLQELDKNNLEYLRKLSTKERIKALNFPIYKIPFLTLDIYKLYKQSITKLLLNDGIKELLDTLNSRGYNMAIISSNSEYNIKQVLSKYGIDYINEIFCSNKIFGKDAIIKKFLKKHNLKNSEVIYVGDEQRDIEACKKAGIKIIWVEWGFDIIDVVKRECPDYIAKTPYEILSIV